MRKIEGTFIACALLSAGCSPTFSGAAATPGNADPTAANPVPTSGAPTRARHVATHPKGDRPRGLMWGGFLTGAAGVATGAVAMGLAASSRGTASGIEANCPQPGACASEAQSNRDAANTQQNVSYVGFGVGAVGIALGLADLLFFSKPVKQADVERRAIEGESSAQRDKVRIYATPSAPGSVGGGVGVSFD